MYLEFDLAKPAPTKRDIYFDRGLAFVALSAKLLLPMLAIIDSIPGPNYDLLALSASVSMVWFNTEVEQILDLRVQPHLISEAAIVSALELTRRLKAYRIIPKDLELENYCKTVLRQQRRLVFGELGLIVDATDKLLAELSAIEAAQSKPAAVAAALDPHEARDSQLEKPVFGLATN